jgi:hypothetical protein
VRFLFFSNDFCGYYQRCLEARPALREQTFDAQCSAFYRQMHYLSDSFPAALQALGHEGRHIMWDSEPLQFTWARENGISAKPEPGWQRRIALAQIELIKPDAVFFFAGPGVDAKFLEQVRRLVPVLVCNWAEPFRDGYPFESYELILSSVADFVEHFRSLGLRSELLHYAFDHRILNDVETTGERQGVVFVGSLTRNHPARTAFLESLAENYDFDFFGRCMEPIATDSPLLRCYRGEVYGLDMYRIYARYKIAIHLPADIGRIYAGAKRPFEVTGAGALLLTEQQPGLDQIFEIGREIVTFTDPGNCREKIEHFLDSDHEREEIATAGQQRTLKDHTYLQRARRVLEILGKHGLLVEPGARAGTDKNPGMQQTIRA